MLGIGCVNASTATPIPLLPPPPPHTHTSCQTNPCYFDAGRPFILELINPRKENLSPEQMKILQSAVNNTSEDIHVRDLQMIERLSI